MSVAIEALKQLGPALLDAWYVVDDQDRIIEFNAAFHALFPRPVGRQLKTLTCREALPLPPCATQRCLRTTCVETGPLRMDELEAELNGERLRFILSATPVALPSGAMGALILLRNVTDDARVQSRYQTMVDEAERERRSLQLQLEERTREVLAANQELNRLEQEIARLRRGGL